MDTTAEASIVEKPKDDARQQVASAHRAGGRLFQQFLPLVGDGQFPAALLATTRQQFAAILGFHALTEAVYILAGTAGRLVGTFHRLSNVIEYKKSKIGAQR